MKIPQIQMQSQMGKININQTGGRQEIIQTDADVSINQPPAEMTIQTVPSKLTIDQTEAWEEMNLMSILKRNEKNAEESSQALMQGIARRAKQGREMMEIERASQPLINQAIENSGRKQKGINITFIPSPFAVKTTYEPSQVDIQVEEKKPVIDVLRHDPEHHYTQGQVTIDMKQYPHLQINVSH